MPKGVPAPFYTGQIKPLISRRDNPNAVITPTSRRIFFEIRNEVELKVPDIVKAGEDTYTVTFFPWTASPGKVLMPYWDIVSPETLALIGPIMGFRGIRLKRVELIKDIKAAAHQQVFILENYIGKRVKVRGETIVLPGEIDQLKRIVSNLSATELTSNDFTELLNSAEQELARAKDKWRILMKASLRKGDINSAEYHALRRIGDIYDIIEGILVREHEARRIINKIQDGFEVAYIRMYKALKQSNVVTNAAGRLFLADWIDEKIIDYLTEKVAAFEPFYSGARTPEMTHLRNIRKHLNENKTDTVINLLGNAMDSIEKFVLGTVPATNRIRNLRGRAERRRP